MDLPRMTESPLRNILLKDQPQESWRALDGKKDAEYASEGRCGTWMGRDVRDKSVLIHRLLVFAFWCLNPHLPVSSSVHC